MGLTSIKIILTNPGHPTSQAKIMIIPSVNFSLVTVNPHELFTIIRELTNLMMIIIPCNPLELASGGDVEFASLCVFVIISMHL